MVLRHSPCIWRRALLFLFLGGMVVADCHAPQTPPEPDARERGPLAERCIRQKLLLWQRRLHLEDWNIRVFMSHPADLRAGTLGNIHWDANKRSAVIRVLSMSDYNAPFQV